VTFGSGLARRLGPVLAATAFVLAGATGAHAQEVTTSVPSSAPLPVGLSLVSQSTWVGLRETFMMKLRVDDPALTASPNAAILIQVHQSTTSRSGFDDVIAGTSLGGTLSVPDQIRVSTLPRDGAGNLAVVFGLSGSGVRPTIGVTQPGVYPVEVQLVNTGTATQSFVTWLVVVDTHSGQPIDKRLSVSLILSAVSDPIVLPDGSDDPKVAAEMKPGGRLDKVAVVLGHTAGFHLSLVLGPETATAWRRLGLKSPRTAADFDRVRAAALRSSTELLPSTYVPIDASAVIAAGLGHFLTQQYSAGSAALRAALGASPPAPAQSDFIDPVPTSDAVVNELRQMLIDRVAVRDPALIPVPHPFSPAEAFVLDTTGGDSRGVATAPFVESLLLGNDPSALRAERVIAALAEVAYETPSIPRGIVIAPPARWVPDVATMLTVIGALRTLPLVQSATLDDLFSTIVTEQNLGADVQRRLVPATPPATPVDPVEYQNTADELSAYRNVVGTRDAVVVEGETALLTALSTTISPERAHDSLARIDAAIHAYTSSVTADEKRITLTSRKAAVPLTFENDLKPARDVKVLVHLDSAKLLFPGGADQIVTLKPGSNTIRFDVEARASGTFPMTISVTSPDGRLAFGSPVTVSVRSAVFGGWAVGVTIAALVFLAGWWANHFRRTRRNRRISTSQPAPAGSA